MARAGKQVELLPIGRANAATFLFRVAGMLFVGVVVKATFKMNDGGAATIMEADPITTADRHDERGVLQAPSDLAPRRPRVDVCLVGRGKTGAQSRVGVARGTRWMLDKRGGVAGPDGETGLGPLSPHAPERASRLSKVDVKDGLANFGVDFDWAYFQLAPSDRQLEALPGDVWVCCEGMVGAPLMRTCLSGAQAGARLFAPGVLSAAGADVPLRPDLLWIDADRGTLTVTWRGHMACPEQTRGVVVMAAGLLAPGEGSLPKTEEEAHRALLLLQAPHLAKMAAKKGGESVDTLVVAEGPPQRAAVLPFRKPAPAEETLDGGEMEHDPGGAVLPFHAAAATQLPLQSGDPWGAAMPPIQAPMPAPTAPFRVEHAEPIEVLPLMGAVSQSSATEVGVAADVPRPAMLAVSGDEESEAAEEEDPKTIRAPEPAPPKKSLGAFFLRAVSPEAAS